MGTISLHVTRRTGSAERRNWGPAVAAEGEPRSGAVSEIYRLVEDGPHLVTIKGNDTPVAEVWLRCSSSKCRAKPRVSLKALAAAMDAWPTIYVRPSAKPGPS
jgi:hypothetical protein